MLLPVFWKIIRQKTIVIYWLILYNPAKAMDYNMSFNVHLSDPHLDFFSENLRTVSDCHGEQFHHHVSTMEKRYQGKWIPSMLANYCWTQKKCATGKI
jgi:hypothetical protein